MRLNELPVIIFDCQATSANPSKGFLFEMGWMITNGYNPLKNENALVYQKITPASSSYLLPYHIRKITGINDMDLKRGRSLWDIWNTFIEDVLCTSNGKRKPIVVIHYARYELPYLFMLQKRYTGLSTLPFDVICTHELTCRLIPDLPRKGLRAVSGYIGQSISPFRRSSHHVSATLKIWEHLSVLLANKNGIGTLNELREFLADKAKTKHNKNYPMPKEERLSLPDHPGLYRMRTSSGDLLYIGKAASIKKRVNSYFQKKKGHTETTLEMLTQVAKIDITVSGSAFEAAMMESDAIKFEKPIYNRSLGINGREVFFINDQLNPSEHAINARRIYGPIPVKADEDKLYPDIRYMFYLIRSIVKEHSHIETAAYFHQAAMELSQSDEGRKIITKGLDLFNDEYGDWLLIRPAIRSVMKMDAVIRHKKLEINKEEEIKDFRDGIFDELIVKRRLENIFLRAAFYIRRGNIFNLVSNCILIWESSQNKREHHILFMKDMVPHFHSSRKSDHANRYISSYLPDKKRLMSYDIFAYDRLRVFITELKRLIAGGRNFTLFLNNMRPCPNHVLIKVLDKI